MTSSWRSGPQTLWTCGYAKMEIPRTSRIRRRPQAQAPRRSPRPRSRTTSCGPTCLWVARLPPKPPGWTPYRLDMRWLVELMDALAPSPRRGRYGTRRKGFGREMFRLSLRQRGDPGKLRFTEERRHPDDPEIAKDESSTQRKFDPSGGENLSAARHRRGSKAERSPLRLHYGRRRAGGWEPTTSRQRMSRGRVHRDYDTGATHSSITQEVVDRCGLEIELRCTTLTV